MTRPFLTARWESLVILNFNCPRELLSPLVPRGTELDPLDGSHMVSLVGFRFVDTRLRGFPIPGHRTFEEANLRFYVRTRSPDGTPRRAVVFIRELVPRRAIATVARVVYNEPYLAVPMSHDVSLDPAHGGHANYSWTYQNENYSLGAEASGPAAELELGSEGEFITEHYWGYTAQRDGGTLEYQVDHPPWRIWPGLNAVYSAPSSEVLYGPEFSAVLRETPRSAFVAVGSEVSVFPGERIS